MFAKEDEEYVVNELTIILDEVHGGDDEKKSLYQKSIVINQTMINVDFRYYKKNYTKEADILKRCAELLIANANKF